MNIITRIKNMFVKHKNENVPKNIFIDINKLDKTKTYVGLEIGTGTISKIIQNLEHTVYKNIPCDKLPSHALVLRYVNKQWMVWECHLKHSGIKQFPLSEYDVSTLANLLIYEYPLNLDTMDYWLNNNPGYSCVNLLEIASERLVGLTLPDTKGWVCSQAVAACNFNICLDMKLEFSNITPADIYFYFNKNAKLIL